MYGLMIVATFADDVGGLLAFTAVFVSMLMTTFKLYKKRLAQNPDGPYFMETPVVRTLASSASAWRLGSSA